MAETANADRARPPLADSTARGYHSPVDDQARIRSLLRRVRRRLRLAQAASDGVVLLSAFGGGALLLVLAAARLGPSPLWSACVWLLVGLTAAAGIWATRRAVIRWHDDGTVARIVDERAALGDLVLSSVELARQLPRLAVIPAVSATLARAEIARAAARCHPLRPRDLVPIGPGRLRLLILALVAASAWAALVYQTERVSQGWKMLATRPSLGRRPPEPIVADIEVALTYPPYTGTAPRRIVGSSGDVLAPLGTTVELWARPLLAATVAAEIAIEPDERTRRSATRPVLLEKGRLAARFVVESSGTYRFALRSSTGRTTREPAAHRIEIDVDREPKVDLRAAADELEVHGPRDKVQLAYRVEDDYGIDEIQLVWQPADAERPEQRRTRVAKGANQRELSGLWQWDLVDLGFPAGVRIAYHLEARDNDAISGAHVGRSRTLHLRVFSPAERHQEALRQLDLWVRQAVSLLGRRIEQDLPSSTTDAGPSLDDRLLKRRRLREQEHVVLEDVPRLRQQLGGDALASPDVEASLIDIVKRMDRLRTEEEQAIRGVADGKLGKPALAQANQRVVAELERAVLLLDDLVARARLEQLLTAADQLSHTRDRLRSLLQAYRGSRGEAARQRIERELKDLERQLTELEHRVAQLAGEAPDEFLNRQAMASSDLRQRLASLRSHLTRGDIDRALAELGQLSGSVDRMVAALEGNLRTFRRERFSSEERALGELESKLVDLEHEERLIAEETDGLRQRARQEEQRVLRERFEPLLRQARTRAADVKKRLAAIENAARGSAVEEPLERARRSLAALELAIEHGDLEELRLQARESERDLYSLQFALYNEEVRQWMGLRPPLQRARQQALEAEAIASKLEAEIEALSPTADALLTAPEKAKLHQLEQRQGSVRQRTSDARQALERHRGANPGMIQLAGNVLKEAAESMDRAEQGLARQLVRRAAGDAWQAVEALGELRRHVGEGRRPRRSEQLAEMARDEVVKIPGSDDSRAPRAFRQDLLDAMKRAVPEAYRQQVKRFYEELAR